MIDEALRPECGLCKVEVKICHSQQGGMKRFTAEIAENAEVR